LNSNNVVFKKRPAKGQTKASILKIIDFSDENKTYGTPSHMAPELWSDEKPNKQSDVYSAGVILIELISLKVLFDGFEWYNIVYFHMQGKTLLDENEEWPESIKEILRRCLNREASRRPSFEKILEDLDKIRDEFSFDDDNEAENGVNSENVYNAEENKTENSDQDNGSNSTASQLDDAPIPSSLI
jgi:serine/threonine protein kinase